LIGFEQNQNHELPSAATMRSFQFICQYFFSACACFNAVFYFSACAWRHMQPSYIVLSLCPFSSLLLHIFFVINVV